MNKSSRYRVLWYKGLLLDGQIPSRERAGIIKVIWPNRGFHLVSERSYVWSPLIYHHITSSFFYRPGSSIFLHQVSRVRYPLLWQTRVGLIDVKRLLQFEKRKKVLGKIRATIPVPGTNFWSGNHSVPLPVNTPVTWIFLMGWRLGMIVKPRYDWDEITTMVQVYR